MGKIIKHLLLAPVRSDGIVGRRGPSIIYATCILYAKLRRFRSSYLPVDDIVVYFSHCRSAKIRRMEKMLLLNGRKGKEGSNGYIFNSFFASLHSMEKMAPFALASRLDIGAWID